MHADPQHIVPSVKLFPRLAMTTSNKARLLNRSPHRGCLNAAAGVDSREARRSRVRARLLRMILDNEEVRRNDQRPNAS
jgi:hypothetical protein